MSANIMTGEISPVFRDGREELRKEFEAHLQKIDPTNAKRRAADGPPIFEVGETIELRGARFRVARIAKNMLLLRPLKG